MLVGCYFVGWSVLQLHLGCCYTVCVLTTSATAGWPVVPYMPINEGSFTKVCGSDHSKAASRHTNPWRALALPCNQDNHRQSCQDDSLHLALAVQGCSVLLLHPCDRSGKVEHISRYHPRQSYVHHHGQDVAPPETMSATVLVFIQCYATVSPCVQAPLLAYNHFVESLLTLNDC